MPMSWKVRSARPRCLICFDTMLKSLVWPSYGRMDLANVENFKVDLKARLCTMVPQQCMLC